MMLFAGRMSAWRRLVARDGVIRAAGGGRTWTGVQTKQFISRTGVEPRISGHGWVMDEEISSLVEGQSSVILDRCLIVQAGDRVRDATMHGVWHWLAEGEQMGGGWRGATPEAFRLESHSRSWRLGVACWSLLFPAGQGRSCLRGAWPRPRDAGAHLPVWY